MKNIFRLLIVALLMIPAVNAGAKGYELTRQESDSVSNALASLWGDYIKKKAEKDGKAVTDEYMRGLEEALKMAKNDDAYFQGIEEGVLMAQRLRQVEALGGFKVDIDRFAYVLQRIRKGRPSGFNAESAETYMNRLMARIADQKAVVDGSAEYLEKASKREGVIKTPSGLLFEVITEGEGETPGPNDAVLLNYVGRFIDNSIFNTSPDNGEGAVLYVNQTIPGFSEGLQMMKKGGTYRLYIPSELGYGEEGVAGLIPGGAATIFDVELLDLKHANEPAPAETPAEVQSGASTETPAEAPAQNE